MDLFNLDDEMDDFNNNLDKYLNLNKEQEPTKLKISIMSATASFNTILNLKTLSKFLKRDENICFIDNMFNMTRKISNVSKKKIFYNQITLKIRPYYNPTLDINLNLMVNLKLFRNGKLQLCGLKNEKDGILAIKILNKKLNQISHIQYDHVKILKKKFSEKIVKTIVDQLFVKNIYLIDYDTFKNIINNKNKMNAYIKYGLKENKFSNRLITNIIDRNIINLIKYNITLINSDFYIGFKINRINVYDYVLNKCNLLCDFDPCIYQGVLIKFYWNYNKKEQDGKCNCIQNCNGKGSGCGNGECKKITISIFQSGNIIITGKCNRDELYYIYNFTINLIKNNEEELKQHSFSVDNQKIKRRNISILIKK